MSCHQSTPEKKRKKNLATTTEREKDFSDAWVEKDDDVGEIEVWKKHRQKQKINVRKSCLYGDGRNNSRRQKNRTEN